MFIEFCQIKISYKAKKKMKLGPKILNQRKYILNFIFIDRVKNLKWNVARSFLSDNGMDFFCNSEHTN